MAIKKSESKLISEGILSTDRSYGVRQITVEKPVLRETLKIDHSLVARLVYEHLNNQGLIFDCDKYELDPNMTYEIFSGDYTLTLEKIVDNEYERILAE
ncbi:hypothetical protein PP939_gp153 [Rhizobium phage RL38J1]|uniref:Uncharacterized protein n=1 Tax=Rhizobium phage RL38J1 TaxID=2663232 RepID=A0A6B9J3F1_9CAUD|nr:hypothetical protein PP939_gp153 [Rhizobium phage RL38J1]QGZ13988.1 hypothetical protein RL38J1_153 [Rhizobium phage RL38J1]